MWRPYWRRLCIRVAYHLLTIGAISATGQLQVKGSEATSTTLHDAGMDAAASSSSSLRTGLAYGRREAYGHGVSKAVDSAGGDVDTIFGSDAPRTGVAYGRRVSEAVDSAGAVTGDEDDEEEEGAEVFDMCMHYSWGGVAVALVFGCGVTCTRRHPKTAAEGCISNAYWPEWLRTSLPAAILILLVLPSLLFVVCFVLAVPLWLFEPWGYEHSFEYVLGNVFGIGPIFSAKPESVGGIIVDVIVSLWALLVSSTMIGMAAAIGFSAEISSLVPQSTCGLIRALFMYLPVILAALASALGMVMASVEGWPLSDGILYLISSLCGLNDPLTDVEVVGHQGFFLETIVFALEMSIGGTIVGMIGSHPAVGLVLRFCEGIPQLKHKGHEEESKHDEAVPVKEVKPVVSVRDVRGKDVSEYHVVSV